VSLRVAQAVAMQARKDGLTEQMDAGDMYQRIRNKMWAPVYRPYRRKG
jgi:malate dehydrogenase (oxaloacetate-decarboxylating)